MAETMVERCGRGLLVKIPATVVEATGLNEGEMVVVEAAGGVIVIRRSSAPAGGRTQAEAAAAEISAESKHYSLAGTAIRELLDEGRRG
jgi:antitoxin MazE